MGRHFSNSDKKHYNEMTSPRLFFAAHPYNTQRKIASLDLLNQFQGYHAIICPKFCEQELVIPNAPSSNFARSRIGDCISCISWKEHNFTPSTDSDSWTKGKPHMVNEEFTPHMV